MINFSENAQAFYDLDIEYAELPSDLVEVTEDQHLSLLTQINLGFHIFSDLTLSDQKPSQYHKWIDNHWLDDRTDEEIESIRLAQFKPLTRRQFKLALLENDLLETIEQAIATVSDKSLKMRIQIEYSESERFERSNESVQYMLSILNLTEQQVDEMWLYALSL